MNLSMNIGLNEAIQKGSKEIYKPIELKIDLDHGLKYLDNQRNEKELSFIDLYNQNQRPSNHQGLISCMRGNINDRLKAMICVTAFREPLPMLQKTLNGIFDNIKSFQEKGIYSHQLGVVVMFDGLENIHNIIDQNGSNYHDNIIPYFNTQIDDMYGINKEDTLESQYWKYRKHKKRVADYCPENILKLRKNKQYLINKFKKHHKSLKKTMHQQGHYLPQDEWIEQNIIDAMQTQYKESIGYVSQRNNTAWVYQTRYDSLPIFYVFKFQNGSKLSSHMWFFKGFCKVFNPEYCMLLDCGASPDKDAIYKLVMQMEAQPQLGGVCGYMHVEDDIKQQTQQPFIQNIFSIEKCQQCEYDIGHILDKQSESILNYIHVLPGAFSGYRFSAFSTPYSQRFSTSTNIQEGESSQRQIMKNQQYNILDQYLRQVMDTNYEHQTLQEANMFLAEDRVLCQLLYCNGYYLRYVQDAHVYVDAPKTLVDLLFQRRRWINGSWFALNYVIEQYPKTLYKNHTFFDQILFKFSVATAQISQITQYFFVTFQVLWLFMICTYLLPFYASSLIMGLYIYIICVLIFLSLTYDASIATPSDKEYYFKKYYAISSILGLINLGQIGATLWVFVEDVLIEQSQIAQFTKQPSLPANYYIFLIILNIGLNALPFLLQFFSQPQLIFKIAINSIHYLFYQPTYTHLFIIYSFCRIDDLSWGTKGLTIDQSSGNKDKIVKKFYFITKWLVLNTIISVVLCALLKMQIFLLAQSLILCVTVFLSCISLLKGVLSCIYHFKFRSHKKARDQYAETQKPKKEKISLFAERLNQIFQLQ